MSTENIVMIAVGFVLCFVASFAKAHMDTIVFRRTGFGKYPEWLRAWLLKMETDSKKKTWDGWHVMQSVWHLAYALAFYLFGHVAAALAGKISSMQPWMMGTLLFGAVWSLRLAAHYLGFSKQYPIQ